MYEGGGGGSRAVMGAKGAKTHQDEDCFIRSPGSIYASARAGHGLFFLGGKEV
jgi:hypothetical protein